MNFFIKAMGFIFRLIMGNLMLAGMLALAYSYLQIVFPILPGIRTLDIWFAASCIGAILPTTREFLFIEMRNELRRKNPEALDSGVMQFCMSVSLYVLITFFLWIDYLVYLWLR